MSTDRVEQSWRRRRVERGGSGDRCGAERVGGTSGVPVDEIHDKVRAHAEGLGFELPVSGGQLLELVDAVLGHEADSVGAVQANLCQEGEGVPC